MITTLFDKHAPKADGACYEPQGSFIDGKQNFDDRGTSRFLKIRYQIIWWLDILQKVKKYSFDLC